MTRLVHTACPYCGVGCGVLARPTDKGVEIKGDPDHPANLGRLCSKGSALAETIGLDGRLLAPRIGGKEASWDQATQLVADRFADTIAEHGPDSVAFYVSGQLLTEDYYVANKLMKGFIGSANIDTNSRLCMASSVAGHKRAFGSDTVPGTYEDLEEADLIVLVGSNLAWCHPVLYQRIAAAKAARPSLTVVNIDPRRTATCDLADLHLPLAPGSDVALFNGLLDEIEAQGAIDAGYVLDHVNGMPEAMGTARAGALQTEENTGLDRRQLQSFFDLWVRTEKVVTLYSQGVNQSSAGTDKVNAILNCHLATGRIGKPGMGPFSVTGQPNAMGGREVGGLANILACHLEIENPTHRETVQRAWDAPTMCTRLGLKAVDMFRAVADGRIKALWVMSTNPAVSMPEADAVKDAIAACPFTVVSDIFPNTDTAVLADVLLPATAWGEKSGTVTNSDRTISRQRAFLPSPGEARPDWKIVCDVAAAMGWGRAFAFETPAAIFREHAALSAAAADLGRDFDIGGLAELSDAAYERLAPVRWPVPKQAPPIERYFADGQFYTPDRRANMIPVTSRSFDRPVCATFPLRLNTGRVRDHWHTLTRTGRAPRLSQHIAEPFAEIHPRDAERFGIEPAGLVALTGPEGKATVRALITDRVQQGTVFAPMHWTAEFSSEGRIDAIVGGSVDPVSGQPELKGSPVAIAPFTAHWYGFAIGSGLAVPDFGTDYWALAKTSTGWRAELAALHAPSDWGVAARAILGQVHDMDLVSCSDAEKGTHRFAFVHDGVVTSALFIAREPVPVSRSHAISMLEAGTSAQVVMAGRPGGDQPDPGATICSCFDVGVNTITEIIRTGKVQTVDQIGTILRAGSNCGSCRPELKALLARASLPIAAE